MLALLALASLLPTADTLLPGRALFARDVSRYYRPTALLLRRLVLGGELPHWNRAFSAGQPLAANPEFALFYPPRWLVFLPSFDLGFALHVVVHAPIAAIGMYLFLRSLRLRIAAAFFGGLVLALGGLFSSNLNLFPILFSLAWVPWVLLFARRFLRGGGRRDLAAAGICLGLEGLAGEPTTLLQTALLVVGYALLRAQANGRSLLSSALLSAAVGAAGFAVAAVQLVPAADLAGDGSRSRSFDLATVGRWSMPLARPLELLFPNAFGHVLGTHDRYWGGGVYPDAGSPFLFSVYLGLLAAALAGGAALAGDRRRGAVGAACALSFLLAVGTNTPLYSALLALGIPMPFRHPEKFAFLGLFALIVLAAVGFDRLVRRDAGVRLGALGVTLGATSVASLLAIVSFTPLAAPALQSIWGLADPERLARAVDLSRQDWLLAAIRGAALALLLAFSASRRKRLWFATAMLFVLADLVPIGLRVAPRIDTRYFEPPATLAELGTAGRLFHEADWEEGTPQGRSWFESAGRNLPWIVRNGLFPMMPAAWGRETVLERDYDKTQLGATLDFTQAMQRLAASGVPDWRERMAAMANVTRVARFRRVADDPLDPDARPVALFTLPAGPRYYFADRLLGGGGIEDLVTAARAPEWTPRTAVVPAAPFAPGACRVTRWVERSDTARVDVECAARSFLVASVTRHRYWHARIDGAPAELLPANVGFMGLVVPAGRHAVAFAYRNPLVAPCGIVSLLAAATLGALAALSSRRR